MQLPRGYHIDWEGEYESQKRAEARLLIIVPFTILLIFVILYSDVRLVQVGAADSGQRGHGPIGGLLALLVTGTQFQRLLGHRVPGACSAFPCRPASSWWSTSISCAPAGSRSRTPPWKERCSGFGPIMMTMLVATLGLLPAAMSHAIGSDSQRPFAIVIVGGLIADLLMSIFLLPTFYVWWAGPTDRLPAPEESKSVYE